MKIETTSNLRAEESKEQESEPRMLVMSAIGRLGRFGNQIFQYAFLRIAARASGAGVQCNPWIGHHLFNLSDPPVDVSLTPLIESGSHLAELLDIAPEFLPYVEKASGKKPETIGLEAMTEGSQPGDIIGIFQWHSSAFRSHKNYFRSLFQPRDDLLTWLNEPIEKLRSLGKTVVVIHLRTGDYRWLPQFSFTLVVPPRWWVEWLDSIWANLDDPVLYVCSNDIDAVQHWFQKYRPLTARDLELKPPERLAAMDVDFYRDYYVMTQADVLGISNSSFSFSAAMMNERAKTFVRPHWDFSTRFKEFDPWDDDPLLFLEGGPNRLRTNYDDMLRVARRLDGRKGMLASALLYHPAGIAIMLAIRLQLAYRGRGLRGVFDLLLRRRPPQPVR